ncbi:MAG: acyl-CoA dehydrogenase family protein [Acetobacteraceae bacterium]
MTQAQTQLLADIRQLAPHIAARAAEFEAGRRIPPDLIDTLRSLGMFRMFAPRSRDGLEMALPEALDVIAAIARIDGSFGWTAMIGSGSAIFAPLVARETYERVYRDGPDVILAGSIQPSGTAEATAGGWRISGRWPFASGCEHADWIAAFCVMTEDGRPLPGPAGAEGPPLIRGFALPRGDWRIEDTWHAGGLKGTGSHHVALRDVVLPEANFIDLMTGVPCETGPLYGGVLQTLPLFHCAFHVGMAEGALDEIVALASTGRQQFRAASPMRDSEIFQYELGRIAADVRAARAAMEVQAASNWRHALAGTLKDDARYVESTQTAVWIAATCVRIVDACFALGGSGALYETSPLQRRLRDIHTAAQHAAVQQRQYGHAGKLALGVGAAGH